MTHLTKLVIFPLIAASCALGAWLLSAEVQAPPDAAGAHVQGPAAAAVTALPAVTAHAQNIPGCAPSCDLRMAFFQGR